MATFALSIAGDDRPGMLFQVTQVLTESGADIRDVAILHHPTHAELFFECELPSSSDPVLDRLRAMDGIRAVSSAPSMSAIFGKRIIIIGGERRWDRWRWGDRGSRSPQHSRRTDLGRHDSACWRTDSGRGRSRRRALPRVQAAGAGGSLYGRRDRDRRPARSARKALVVSAEHGRAAFPMPPTS